MIITKLKGLVAVVALTGIMPLVNADSQNQEELRPEIKTTPVFKTGFFPGTRTYTNYVELGVTFQTPGTYNLELSHDLNDSKNWTEFGKTNLVNISISNTTRYVSEYFNKDAAEMSNTYFRVSGDITTSDPNAPSKLNSEATKLSK